MEAMLFCFGYKKLILSRPYDDWYSNYQKIFLAICRDVQEVNPINQG